MWEMLLSSDKLVVVKAMITAFNTKHSSKQFSPS